ncbi:helix-turn-helix domain-containing protein [Parafrankia sp. FMc2]|uniref:helix-turn-helix domain-containing protein n=1 Tax=Parafrankia sp. FMc2 TaxID=3233196 RepID=UPI0034D67C10
MPDATEPSATEPAAPERDVPTQGAATPPAASVPRAAGTPDGGGLEQLGPDLPPPDPLTPDSVGQTLVAARRAAGLTIDDVSDRTRIRAALIGQIEHNDFTNCGGAVYARGHLRTIATTLGLDPVPLLAAYDAGHERVPSPVVVASPSPAPATSQPPGVNVRVEARDAQSWLEVRDESEQVLLQQLLEQGDSREVSSEGALEIRMGNAGAVDLSCNGRNLGPAGAPGQVVTVRLALAASGGGCTMGDDQATGLAAPNLRSPAGRPGR